MHLRKGMPMPDWNRSVVKNLDASLTHETLPMPHAAFDAAVLAAYGFSAKADLLAQLFTLNQQVADRIASGDPVTASGILATYPPKPSSSKAASAPRERASEAPFVPFAAWCGKRDLKDSGSPRAYTASQLTFGPAALLPLPLRDCIQSW